MIIRQELSEIDSNLPLWVTMSHRAAETRTTAFEAKPGTLAGCRRVPAFGAQQAF